MINRTSDIKEALAERALFFLFGSAILLVLGSIFVVFRGSGYYVPLGYILCFIGISCLVTSLWGFLQTRKIESNDVKCPFCTEVNTLVEPPVIDFSCVGCNRMIPVEDGKILPAKQVRCGFCNELNYYSDKTEALLCENCDREIPISQDEDGKSTKQIPKAFRVTDDDAMYELILVDPGNHTEELVGTLQHMLALNRNQVKDILENVPSTLLTGINRRKAEMLQAQITIRGAKADISEMVL